jgi:hypothetical protein
LRREETIKYLLIIYGNKDLWDSFPPEEWQAAIAAQDAFNARFSESGELISAFGLSDETSAKAVQVRDQVPVITDGPYVEAKEFVSSLFVIDVESEERALEIAAEIPFASVRGVEVWPVLYGSEVGM